MGQTLLLQRDPDLYERLQQRFYRTPPAAWWRHWRRLRAADAYLLSFPKSGRTWVRVMLGKLLAEHSGHAVLTEIDRGARLPRFPGVPHVVSKHDGSPQLKRASDIDGDKSEFAGCRVMLLIRDPRDTIVSYYFQATRRTHRYAGEIGEFLHCTRGSFDSLLRYYNVWAEQRHVPRQLLLLRYEDLQANPARELRRMAGFMGLEAIDESLISAAVEYASFDAMRNREARRPADGGALSPGARGDSESFKARRGRVGGYMDYLSPADVEWINRRIETELHPGYGYTATALPAPAQF